MEKRSVQESTDHLWIEGGDCWNQIGVWAIGNKVCEELERFIHCWNCPVFSSAAKEVLNRPRPLDYLKECTEALKVRRKQVVPGSKSVFVFRIGSEWLALPTIVVKEVVAVGRIHRMPHRTSKTVRGVVNIRGRIQICISLGGILGIRPVETEGSQEEAKGQERLLVAQWQRERLSFPVSEIMGIVHYLPEEVSEPPASVTGSKKAFTRGILIQGDKEIGLLDPQLLFKEASRNLS